MGKIEIQKKYKGYYYYVIAYEIGHRCGYVEIPKDHKFYEKDYNELYDLDVHGGLTYSEYYLAPLGAIDGWFIGFDCAHLGDGKDFEIMSEEYKKIYSEFPFNSLEEPKTKEYVEKECKHLIDQI